MRVIELPVLGIKIKLSLNGGFSDIPSPGEIEFDDSLSARCPKCGKKDCLYQCDGAHLGEVESEDDVISRISGNGAIDALTALILAHAVAGVDVETPAYLEGIETAIEAIANSS